MINALESHSRILGAWSGPQGTYTKVAIFTAEEDLTLRQVIFFGGASVLSADPTFTPVDPNQIQTDLWLASDRYVSLVQPIYLVTQFTNLAFPVPKGTRLYWGLSDSATSDANITVIFS